MIKPQISNRIRTLALVAASAAFGSLITGTVVSADQGNMIAARRDLNAALTALNNAVADKGGHRENAIGLVKQAIGEVNAGINYANQH